MQYEEGTLEPAVSAFVQGFPHFVLQGGVTLIMLIVGVTVHVLMTPMKELKLIREGNASAGVGLAGIVLGLAIPMSACLASSTSVYDLVIWGAVAILLQMIAFRVADLILRDLPGRIEKDEMGAAIVLVSVKLAAALVMAAALWAPFIVGV